jgi:hypothetical protein
MESIEEEPPPRDQLHGINPWGGVQRIDPRQQLGGIGPHVSHRGDTLRQQISKIQRQLFSCASAGEEEQVNVAIDQAGDQPLAGRVDDSCSGRNGTLTGGAGADNPIPPNQGDRIADWTATGSIPEIGTNDGYRGIGRGQLTKPGRTSATGAQDQRRCENRGNHREGQLHTVRSWRWRATRHGKPFGGRHPPGTCFKLRGKGAFGRDSRIVLHGDQEHYAGCC